MFERLYRALRNFFLGFWYTTVDQSLNSFRANLRAQETIRMWVDNSPGYGHQSSTIAILRQLAGPVPPNGQGFGFQGNIYVYYQEGENNENFAKLSELLPELLGQMAGQVGGAHVVLLPWTEAAVPGGAVDLGFTGGADDRWDAEQRTWTPINFAARINVRYFLRIQPYRWPQDEQIQFTWRAPINLTAQRALQFRTFKERAYHRPPVQEPNWADYTVAAVGARTARQADIIRRLTMGYDGIQPTPICPTYGIRSFGDWNLQLRAPASERMFELVAAILAAQRPEGGTVPLASGRSVAVLSFDEFNANGFDGAVLEDLIEGGRSTVERMNAEANNHEDDDRIAAERQAVIDSGQPRVDWLEQIDAEHNVHYIWDLIDQADFAEFDEDVVWLQGQLGRVLVLQLGRVPPPLFAWCMQQAAWPPVFEGQGSASLALNVGKLYFHVAREDIQEVLYPTRVVGYELNPPAQQGPTQIPQEPPAPSAPRRIQAAANQINAELTPWGDPSPAEIAARVVREYYEELAHPDEPERPLATYLASVQRFYSDARNDKLRVALAFFAYIWATQRPAAAPGASPALETLLKNLEVNTADGKVYIAPGALTSGNIFDFYTGFPGPDGGLVVTGGVEPVYSGAELVSVVVTGSTTSLAGIPLTARVTFTAPEGGILVCDGRYESDEGWAVEEIPWISFSHPFLELHITDSGAPPEASIGGTLDSAGAEIAFRMPVAEGMWQLAAGFDPHDHPIGKFYQLAGGVNLARSLPAPFDGLAGFGLTNVQLVYDESAGEVEYAAFRMATSDGFTLVGDVRVENISASVTVLRPGSLSERQAGWTVQGTFTLGTGKDPAVILISALGPDLVLTGSLASGVLTISDIIAAFCPGIRPALPGEPEITDFQCSFTPATGDYQVSCYLNLNWPVEVAGTTVFTIEGLQLAATSVSGIVAGQLIGYLVIDPTGQAVPLELIASYGTVSGWLFQAVEPPGAQFSLSTVFGQFLPDDWHVGATDYAIADLRVSAAVNEGSWEVSGRTADWWQVAFLDLQVLAALDLGYRAAPADGAGVGYFGRLDAECRWHGVDLTVFYDFNPETTSYGIVWGGLAGLVTGPVNLEGDYVATLRFTRDTTIGSMIETMVSWATGSRFALEAPWSLLNSVSIGGLALTYTFNGKYPERNRVAFTIDIGPIELGFARIDRIGVIYDENARQRVAVTLTGSFPWNTGTGAVGGTGSLGPWDATQPGAAPAAPGTGSKYLDLRLLALGQHVTTDKLAEATTVQGAIELMAKMPGTEPGTIPTATFDAASGWIVGADIGILRLDEESSGAGDGTGAGGGYLVTAQVVFNDPRLYALRLALDGDEALIFKGLDFQIMYRQVSDTVGVYQAEITLPDTMRHLSIGACSVTLPVVAVAVYTNGDFEVDVGFPWNGDFTRSFTVEAVVFPGLPALGSGGFYFGRLSSATTDRVPQASNGTFSPVLAFGLGMRLGFGKSVEYGPLRAGFSVTATGIIEGVIATFNPYLPAAPTAASGEVQGSYYFWLRGTLGITGRLYGSVDFSVVKADVNVAFSLLLQVTYESYVSLSVTVIVAVDVSVSIRIDLGLFSVRLSFSFALRIEETFSIENTGSPPWLTAGPTALPQARRVRGRHRPPPALMAAAAAEDRWSRLQRSAGAPLPLTAWLVPGLTVAHNEWDPDGLPSQQVPCYVLLPVIESVADSGGTVDEVVEATAAAGSTSFETLATMVLRWVIAAGQEQNVTPEEVNQLLVTEAVLTHLLEEVLVSTDADPVPIRPEDVNTFLGRQFLMTMQVPDGKISAAPSATAFPMPPPLRISAQPFGSDYPGCDYRLDEYNALDDAGLSWLREYFDRLAVQVAEQAPVPGARQSAGGTLSMAEWVQSDYFLLLARQMTQAALDSLADFKYPAGAKTPEQIVGDVNGNLPAADWITVAGLFAVNSGTPLRAGAELTLGPGVTAADRDSFESVATGLGSAVTATGLAMANAGSTELLRAGARIVCQDAVYDVADGDSLITVARNLKVRFADLLSGSPDLLTRTDLLKPEARLRAPLVTCQARADSTFATLAAGYPSSTPSLTGSRLADQNAARPVLRTGAVIGYGDLPPYTVAPNDCLADVALHFQVSLAVFLDKSDVVRQEHLLADVAALDLPPFGYKAAAGETLTAVATRLAASVDILAMAPENTVIPNLFGTDNATGTAAWIALPRLPQYQAGAIIDEIQRTLGIRQLSGMAARYTLAGTRLPTDHIVPKAQGMWVMKSGSGLTLPKLAGLFALTGQQLQVPLVTPANPSFNITVSRPDDLTWLTFPDKSTKLPIHVEYGTEDAARIAELASTARGAPFQIPLNSLGADPMYERRPASYPLTTLTEWSSPAVVTLPYGPGPKEGHVQRLRLWTLPGALRELPDPATPGKTIPRFAIRLTSYDPATGATSSADIASHAWATVVEFTVRRVPPVATSPATLDSYEIMGAGGADVALLERMVAEISSDGAIDQLVLAFGLDATADGSAGLQTDPQDKVVLGIAQVNLSTQTRPPIAAAAATAAPSAAGHAQLLNTKRDFIRLLWEASITRTGGFYLYYHDGADGRGLPERIFTDRGDARVSLIVLYSAPQAAAAQDRVRDYMTAAVTADNFDDALAAVVAEAAPDEPQVTATSDLTLAWLAELTYTDIADLATDNAGLTLAVEAPLRVTGGVYQAPPPSPTALAKVAELHGTTVEELNQANQSGWPQGLPAELPPLTAIYLPPLTVAGASAHAGTLADVASYYGVALATLAASNAGVPGLFKPGQPIKVAGGPMQRTATVPPGSAAVTASRAKPGDVPPHPGGDYALRMLQNTFSMLGYQLTANVFFNASGCGLPAGPQPPAAPGAPPPASKVRLASSDSTWEYRQSLGYAPFAISPSASVAGLPAESGDPYRGLGRILQVGYTWQDYYGNTLVTSLTSPPEGTKPPYNRPPLVTGYTDPLIALGQWPSISPAWRVAGAAGQARLELLLGFDPTRYQGLISAAGTGPSQIVASFTDPLDPASANLAANYHLDHGATVTGAELAADGLSVTLTTGAPLAADREYLLTVSGLLGTAAAGAPPPSYAGSATVRPAGAGTGTSSLTERASRDLGTYSALYYQLTDTNGVAAEIATSMLAEAVPLTVAQWDALLGWLFAETASVYRFVADRAAGGTTVPAPAASHVISVPLNTQRLDQSQICELWVSLALRRTGGQVLPGLDTTAGITSARTPVPPFTDPIDRQGTLGLATFASDFETAMTVTGSHVFKVATGVNRYAASVSRDGAALWAVRIGTLPGQAISYTISDPGAPELFAPRPVSNQLQSRQAVPIYDYKLAKGGISTTPDRKLNFADVDMDLWGRFLLTAVDDTLSPAFVSAMRVVTAKQRESDPAATDYLQQILDQKKLIAEAVSAWMIPLYGGTADPGPVREAFYQQLLSRLSNAYATAAGIQFHADVSAQIDNGAAAIEPRLFGDVLEEASAGLHRSEISFTSPKLPLHDGIKAPLPFLLTAPETVDSEGVVVGSLDVALRWQASAIEHQIGEPVDAAGYTASSWLSFVISDEPGQPGPLVSSLGRFAVPLVLRTFPAGPSMTAQSGIPEHPDTADLAALRQWTYTLTWSVPFHYVQDRIHGEVEFNLTATPAAQAADLFPPLAEFVTVYPDVRADLEAIVARIDATTTDARQIKDAEVTLASFVRLLSMVTTAMKAPTAQDPGGLTVITLPRALAGQQSLTYAFTVAEDFAEVEDPAHPGTRVRALLVTITGTVPAGMGVPVVAVDPDRYEPVEHGSGHSVDGDWFSYVYQHPKTYEYLSQADGQKISDRTLKLSGLDVFQRQDAWSGIYLTRNEQILPGQPPLADAFVYKTALARFADPMAPTISSAEPVDIARIGAPGPQQRSLEEHLTALFGELFTAMPPDASQLIIGVETVYRYQLVPGMEPVELPIFFQAPVSVAVPDSGPGTPLAAMITAWSEAIRTWFASAPPNPADGHLHLDLTTLSNLTATQKPLLRIRNLALALTNITPPLPTGT